MPCFCPVTVKGPKWAIQGRYIAVPCGRCVACKLERARQWTIRIMHEAQGHRDNSFITLTYEDEHLSYGNKQATLVKSDLQKFWKRLRKEINVGIRYFACGEYGEQRQRPHYHACVFGFDFPDKVILRSQNGLDLYRSDLLDNVWSFGHCSVGALTASSAAYVARYILDKNLGKESVYYEQQGIEPEFTVMSRGSKKRGTGGIGSAWFRQYASDVFPSDRVVSDSGKTSRPPRYYDELRKASFPKEMIRIKRRRMELADKIPLEERIYSRILSKKRFAESRLKNFQKSLH